MPASKVLQLELNKLHNEFIISNYNEPLEYLQSINYSVQGRIRKYVKIWRNNKRMLIRKRKLLQPKYSDA